MGGSYFCFNAATGIVWCGTRSIIIHHDTPITDDLLSIG